MDNDSSQISQSKLVRTLTKSNGCPTNTAINPPTPPDKKLFKEDAAADGLCPM